MRISKEAQRLNENRPGAERVPALFLDTGSTELGNATLSPEKTALSVEKTTRSAEKTALSLGERVSRDGAFSSRRGTGEGFLPFASQALRLNLRIRYSPPAPPNQCEKT
jgi:hypothetical protein